MLALNLLFAIGSISAACTSNNKSFTQKGCVAEHSGAIKPYQTTIPLQCFTSTKSGKCQAAFKSFHYDPKDGQCKESLFGGCSDGCLAYKTKKECEDSCHRASLPVESEEFNSFAQSSCKLVVPKIVKPMYKDIPATCFVPTVTGKCRGFSTSFHFDVTKGSCVESNYGGCDDGCQAFKTIEECEKSCWRASIDV